jgi:hypothetical protein
MTRIDTPQKNTENKTHRKSADAPDTSFLYDTKMSVQNYAQWKKIVTEKFL